MKIDFTKVGNVFDRDFCSVVYPKYIKIACEVELIIAEVNFSE